MYSHSYFIFNSSFATRQLNCCRRKVICQFQRLLLLYRRVTEKKKHKEILKSRMELYVLTNDNGGAADNALYSEGTGGESAFLNLNRLTRGKQATEWLLDTSVCLWPHHPEGGQSHPVFPLLSTIVRLILSEVKFYLKLVKSVSIFTSVLKFFSDGLVSYPRSLPLSGPGGPI